ncbi:ankyrin repeat domain-containing protein [Virgisporangium aurantiacum]|uniref:Ankyrin repeat n=1 Tax=Virgisporangium aurantiacum TaxID=175570 RepID=A0A8J3Z501_9ACTN|nr:ankyrin repeat domain-containing protein [Virgisporangium aurantiacum]GIJ57419.1 hypothetical protein Vau01_049350 [Virgisporangium aurantiacum]
MFTADDPPLHRAAHAGDVDEVRRLLDAGAAVDAWNAWGETALGAAADSGSAATVALLLSAGADPARSRDRRGRVALHHAATADVARLLLDTPTGRAVVDSGGRGGLTPLHLLVPRDRVGAVAVLLEHGADPHLPGRTGSTALHLATSAEMVRTLVAAGASPNIRDGDGRTPLFTARGVGAVRELLAAGADPHLTDRANRTPLHAASRPDVIGTLIAAGIPVDATDRRGWTPLAERTHFLSEPYQDHDEAVRVVEVLIAAGADVAHRDVDGTAPIHRLRRPPSVLRDNEQRLALRARMREVAENALPPDALRVSGTDGPQFACARHPHRAEAVTATSGGVLVRWSHDTAEPTATDRPYFVALDASPDGTLLALGAGENQPPELRRWDRLDDLVAVFDGIPASDSVAFSPDGRLLAVGWWSPGGGDGLAVVDVTGRRIVAETGGYHGVERVGFAPDGTLVVAWIVDDDVSVLDTLRADLTEIDTFGSLDHRVHTMDFAAGGRLVVSGPTSFTSLPHTREPERVTLLDRETRTPVWSVGVDARAGRSPRHPATPRGAHFVDGGRLIAVGRRDGLVHLDPATGTVRQ